MVPVPEHIEKQMIFQQRLWEPALLEQIALVCSKCSYRGAAEISNGLLRRNEADAFSYRTLQDTICREGKLIEEKTRETADQALETQGFDPVTGHLRAGVTLPGTLTNPQIPDGEKEKVIEKMKEALEKYNGTTEIAEEQIKWENVVEHVESMPEHTVVLCVDDVGVHHQKESRRIPEEKPEGSDSPTWKKDARSGKTTAETTVVYLRAKEGVYRFAAETVLRAVLTALGYLLYWGMLNDRELLIFSDGARNIKNVIEDVFSFRPYTLDLDWYHLRKHCYEVFTMALTGGAANKKRNETIRYHFEKRLFAGNIEEALEYLEGLDPDIIKNQKKIEEIKGYIGRKREGIYVYAMRKQLGLINSSNQGEKSNDLVVAQRCKHNGMSWTYGGLNGMRNIKLLILNQEMDWYTAQRITFQPVALSPKIACQYDQVA